LANSGRKNNLIHEARYFGKKVAGLLLKPNQLQAIVIMVGDIPHQSNPNSTQSHRGQDKDSTPIQIPLELNGIMPGFGKWQANLGRDRHKLS